MGEMNAEKYGVPKMTADKARELLNSWFHESRDGVISRLGFINRYADVGRCKVEAEGYLAALEGSEVRALVEKLEYATSAYVEDSGEARDMVREALSAFQKAVKP